MGASYNRGKSNQVVSTPKVFLEAVEKRFGKITHDLAANKTNAVVKQHFFDEGLDSLSLEWKAISNLKGWNWLNPPYSNIGEWVKKCYEQMIKHNVKIIVLIPYSGSTKWWRDFVHSKAVVIPIGPKRITFVGQKNPYPKDLCLVVYCHEMTGVCEAWDWTKDVPKKSSQRSVVNGKK